MTFRKTLLAAALAVTSGSALADARIAVLHLAPFADDVDATQVDIFANGTELLSDLKFGDFTPDYVSVPAGTYDIDVIPEGATDPAISATFELMDNTDYTVWAGGDGVNQPLDLFALVDDNAAPAAGNLKLRIVHAAPFADTLEGTEVSIRTDGGDLVGGLTGVPFGVDSGFLEIPAATYDLKVSSNDGNQNFIDIAPVDLPAGAVLTVFATGDGSNQPLGVLAWPLGELPLEIANNGALTGWWQPVLDDGSVLTGQGVVTLEIPSQDRLVGTVYTFAPDGSSQAWFTFDSCQNDPGAMGCAVPGGLEGDSVTAAVYNTTGGVFLQDDMTMAEQIGTLDIDFDAGCTTARASLLLDGETTPVEFDVTRIEPVVSCNIP